MYLCVGGDMRIVFGHSVKLGGSGEVDGEFTVNLRAGEMLVLSAQLSHLRIASPAATWYAYCRQLINVHN